MPVGAGGATASNLTKVFKDGDAFWNYDYIDTYDASKSNRVDWPMNFLFHSNAEVDKVKNGPLVGYPWVGGNMYSRLNDEGTAGGWVWDNDRGKKNVACPGKGVKTPHIRFYADSDDRMYNVSWGYYVIASSHQDVEECTSAERFGWSEDAEHFVADEIRGAGYSVTEDWGSFYNFEPNHWDTTVGNHYWQNNRYATLVKVP